MEKKTIHFYTRDRCHLCENAKLILEELQHEWNFTIKEYNIDGSDELTEKYGLMIPVVVLDGEEIAFGQIQKQSISNRLQEKSSSL